MNAYNIVRKVINYGSIIIVAGALVTVAVDYARSAEWAPADMNKAIEQTNFTVGGGCSGTLISIPEKLVLTNFHCIDDFISFNEREIVDSKGFVKKMRERRLADVPVAQHTYDGFARVSSTSYVGELVGENQRRDLAIIRIKSDIPHTYASPILPNGQKVLRGERVYAVGNPAGNYATVVEGIVSSVNRTFEFPWTENAKLPMIQFSGGIYGGNSGGALYNSRGQLIGVPAAGYSGANFIGLAIPSEIVEAFLRENCFGSVVDEKADDAKCRTDKAASEKSDK